MTSKTIPVEPFDLVIFGITGDLATRKLIPVLYYRFISGQIPPQSRIIGLARSELTSEQFKNKSLQALEQAVSEKHYDREMAQRFVSCLHYIKNDVNNDDDWDELLKLLKDSPNSVLAFYLSVAPSLFAPIVEQLGRLNLAENSRLVVEKPFGRDLASARKLQSQIGCVFKEEAIYRIDHYLGKETVQNLMALRFANKLFEPLWNSNHIDHIQITAAESLGVEGRGEYYDNVGAMRDMVQNHLMQLLCLTAMEPPYKFDANAMRDEKLKVLRALRPLTGEDALRNSVRGQYLATASAPSYLHEANNKDSQTETYVALKAEINSWRWAGTPFYLRTGKRLRSQMTEIVIKFRSTPHSIFGQIDTPIRSNALVIRLQPDEGLNLSIMTKDPGPGGFRLRETPLDMTFADNSSEDWRMPDAYERLIMDVIRGNQTLFMRDDEVEAAWNWIDPIMQAWSNSGMPPESYDSYGSGPEGGIELIVRDNRRWRDIVV